MPRYIDADAIYDTLSDIFIEYLATSSNTDTRNALDSLYHTVLSAVETVPTISPDDVRGVGKWDRVETEFGLRCPKCGKLLDEYVNGGEWVDLVEIPNYCPNCGAKMEVSEDA